MYTQDGLTLNILQVVSFKNVIALTEHLVPILLSFYIGSWSDRFGRKPFLAFCMIGRTLGAVGNLISGIWLDEVSRWEWLALYMPVQNISGGTLTFIMMTYSFIADNSTPRLDQRYTSFYSNNYLFRERLIRLAVLGFFWDMSYLVSLPIGAFLFSSGSYVCVLGTSVTLYSLACVLGAWRLWGFEEKLKKSEMSIKGRNFYLIVVIN